MQFFTSPDSTHTLYSISIEIILISYTFQQQALWLLSSGNQPLRRHSGCQCHCHTCGRKTAGTWHCCQCIWAIWDELSGQEFDQMLQWTCSDLKAHTQKQVSSKNCYKVLISLILPELTSETVLGVHARKEVACTA